MPLQGNRKERMILFWSRDSSIYDNSHSHHFSILHTQTKPIILYINTTYVRILYDNIIRYYLHISTTVQLRTTTYYDVQILLMPRNSYHIPLLLYYINTSKMDLAKFQNQSLPFYIYIIYKLCRYDSQHPDNIMYYMYALVESSFVVIVFSVWLYNCV